MTAVFHHGVHLIIGAVLVQMEQPELTDTGIHGQNELFRQFFGGGHLNVPQERREHALGSGVIVRSDGKPVFHLVNVIDDLEMVNGTIYLP